MILRPGLSDSIAMPRCIIKLCLALWVPGRLPGWVFSLVNRIVAGGTALVVLVSQCLLLARYLGTRPWREPTLGGLELLQTVGRNPGDRCSLRITGDR